MRRSTGRQCRGAAARGVSIVEAIVAMAVMAFGMMAIVGLQSTLRLNSDIAKQRSEAVRIAEQAIEAARAFSVLPDYDNNVVSRVVDPVPLDGGESNAVYRLTQRVVDMAQGMKSIQVVVSWSDRVGQEQTVTLDSVIAGADPALSGILSVAPGAVPVALPLGRNPAVPLGAVPLDGGKSAFRPPGASTESVWVFDDTSGVITSICTFPAGDDLSQFVPSDCFEQPSWLITGFVRFSFGPFPSAAKPIGEQIDLRMLAVADGDAFADGECFVAPVQDPRLTYSAYFCRVPQSADTTWTGRVLLAPPLPRDPPPDPSIPQLDLAIHDVCRYSNGQPGNVNHPRRYVGLNHPLTEQNFLVVDDRRPYPEYNWEDDCPFGTRPLQPPELLPPPLPPA
jgi:Tfp pilus assembly protein PilV